MYGLVTQQNMQPIKKDEAALCELIQNECQDVPNIKGGKSNQADWHIEYTAIHKKEKAGRYQIYAQALTPVCLTEHISGRTQRTP